MKEGNGDTCRATGAQYEDPVVNFPNEEAFHYGEKISVVSNERSKLDK
jgi:hypothetical protein